MPYFIIWVSPKSIVLIESCNKQAVRANVNKPSDANVCRALCHNTEFILVTYDPQITHGNKSAIENKLSEEKTVHRVEQTFQLETRELDLAKEFGGAYHLTENFGNSGWKVHGKVTSNLQFQPKIEEYVLR